MSLILDAGALIAYERAERQIQSLLRLAANDADPVKTSAAIVAQVWRDGTRQARLAALLRGIAEIPLTPARARTIGDLLRRSRTDDIADASLVELAENGDEILTSDPDDLERVTAASGKTLIITSI